MNMNLCRKAILGGILALLASCDLREDDQAPLLIFPANFDFTESDQGWSHGFAEYPAGPDSALFELKYEYTDKLPESILTKRSVMLSGNNVNRDLFMYLKRKITGLKPNTDYTITYTIDLASEFTSDFFSSSGSVYLKAGATPFEPKTLDDAGFFVMNIDKGEGANGSGQHMISLGDIAAAGTATGYTLLTRNNTMSNSRYVAKTNANGELWLIVGTDSNHEGRTKVFYSKINVVFSAS
jgi:hypothetical protein